MSDPTSDYAVNSHVVTRTVRCRAYETPAGVVWYAFDDDVPDIYGVGVTKEDATADLDKAIRQHRTPANPDPESP